MKTYHGNNKNVLLKQLTPLLLKLLPRNRLITLEFTQELIKVAQELGLPKKESELMVLCTIIGTLTLIFNKEEEKWNTKLKK